MVLRMATTGRLRQIKLRNYSNCGTTLTWIARQSMLPILCYNPNTVIRPDKGNPAQTQAKSIDTSI